MISLISQKDFRALKKLPFCYICGLNFHIGERPTDEHVIPKNFFLNPDRTPPLKLPAHQHCNKSFSDADQSLGQIVHLLHGLEPPPSQDKRKIKFVRANIQDKVQLQPGFLLGPWCLRTLIFRLVRGCHTALYREFLPDPIERKRSILPPFPMGIKSKDGNYNLDLEFHPQFIKMAEILKKNILTNSVDRVICYNSKFKYYCTWTELDDGTPFCIFAINLYDWRKLGTVKGLLSRDCLGAFVPSGCKPLQASTITKLEFTLEGNGSMEIF